MKTFKLSFKLLSSAIILTLLFFVPGCYQATPEELDASGNGANLNIITRSVSSHALQFPVTIYAFDNKGVCRAETMVADEGDQVKLNLGEGNYHLVAVAGSAGCRLPASPSPASLISTQDNNLSTTPLSLGEADVVVKGNSNATILMALKVASVEMQLEGLADDVTAVSVIVAKQYSKIALDGTLSEPANTTIACKKEGDLWTTGKVYMLQGASDATVFSFIITDKDGTDTYSYTFNNPLKAGVPYSLYGSFTSGFSVGGSIVVPGWDNEVALDFNFGPGVEETGGTKEETTTSSEIPAVASVWNGHVVAMVKNESATEADVVLVSLKEWSGVGSASSTGTLISPASCINDYVEFGLDNWRIPTKAEAASLRTLYAGEKLPVINNVLERAGGMVLSISDKSDNARYLCENATYSYSFKESSSITKAGAKTKYLLRLVKTVHVKKE